MWELSLPKFESFKLLWKTSTIILDERFSTRSGSGTSGSIWQHFWLSERGRRKIMVSSGKSPGMLQNSQQCTEQPPTSKVNNAEIKKPFRLVHHC